MIGDLHCHTRFSDGSMGVDDLIFYAKRAGLSHVAITDHDTMDGVVRGTVLGKRYGITVVPAVEVTAMDYTRGQIVHILCYLPDKPDRLLGLLGKMLESRTIAGKKMIAKVMRLFPVTLEHITRYTSGSTTIYKAHVIQALLDLGYDCQTHGVLYNQVFASTGGICAVEPEYYPDVYLVLEQIKAAGGIAVLAHPPEYKSMELMQELVTQNKLDGIELYHPHTSEQDYQIIHKLAKENNLLVTGGSDFHGLLSRKPNPLASCITPKENIDALYEYKRKKKIVVRN